MKGFLLGLVVAGLAFAGYLYLKSAQGPRPAGPVASARDAGPPAKKKRKRARGATRVARAGAPVDRADLTAIEPDPEPEPVKLSAADLRTVGQGDDLSRPDVIKMDLGDKNDNPRELTQDDIDARFRGEESAILECIMSARPDQDTYVPGRVTVKFRIQRSGSVRGVRVEAPAILQKGGLYGCIKKVVLGLHFPASGGSQIVTYPFTLS
jgi:hypothetical protein